VFASALSLVAGYVDAVGFMITGGFFVSFMSGNTTRLGVGVATHAADALFAFGLVGSFVLGAMAGAALGRLMRAQRAFAILSLVSAVLLAAAALASSGFTHLAVPLLAFAMGAENTVFSEDGEVRIGLTYMTGALVKLGKRLTAALYGEDRGGWAPYLLLWLALAVGAALGAMSYRWFGTAALWAGALATALLGVLAPRMRLSSLGAG
jgi:uncharacterized membrane protein YoaK (UPF0700 family)